MSQQQVGDSLIGEVDFEVVTGQLDTDAGVHIAGRSNFDAFAQNLFRHGDNELAECAFLCFFRVTPQLVESDVLLRQDDFRRAVTRRSCSPADFANQLFEEFLVLQFAGDESFNSIGEVFGKFRLQRQDGIPHGKTDGFLTGLFRLSRLIAGMCDDVFGFAAGGFESFFGAAASLFQQCVGLALAFGDALLTQSLDEFFNP